MSLRRVVSLALALLLAACGGEAPQTVFAPLSYDYLRPLRLNVATLDVEDHAVTRDDDVAALSPVPPAQALTQMAHDRVFPGGSAGRAVFVIQDASIRRHGDTLAGSLAVRLDIVAANGQAAAFAEARVARSSTTDEGDLRTRLYALTKQMMDDMNVEFEFQARRGLKAWLQPEADVPGAVSAQPLSGPGAGPSVPQGSRPSAAVPTLAPPPGGIPAAGVPFGGPEGAGVLPVPPGAPEQSGPSGSLLPPTGGPQDLGPGSSLPAASPYSPFDAPASPEQAIPRSSFGQAPYGQPAYGQPPSGQPAFGQPPYGQPAYGGSGAGLDAPYAQPPGLRSGPLPLTP